MSRTKLLTALFFSGFLAMGHSQVELVAQQYYKRILVSNLYVSAYLVGSQNKVDLIDVTNPKLPSLKASFDIPGTLVDADDELLYAKNEFQQIFFAEYKNRQTPTFFRWSFNGIKDLRINNQFKRDDKRTGALKAEVLLLAKDSLCLAGFVDPHLPVVIAKVAIPTELIDKTMRLTFYQSRLKDQKNEMIIIDDKQVFQVPGFELTNSGNWRVGLEIIPSPTSSIGSSGNLNPLQQGVKTPQSPEIFRLGIQKYLGRRIR